MGFSRGRLAGCKPGMAAPSREDRARATCHTTATATRGADSEPVAAGPELGGDGAAARCAAPHPRAD